MGVGPATIVITAVMQFMTSGNATADAAAPSAALASTASTSSVPNRGRVVAAPHGGYDQESEDLARGVAQRLGWGWVRAVGYRSYPYRFWYDVNRPTERPWSSGSFADGRETSAGRRVYREYQDEVRQAARRSGPVDLLVEVHGHNRTVRAGGQRMRVEVIELATTGFTRAQLRSLKAKYAQLQRALPSSQRVTLAIDRLDRWYDYRGWQVPFYFYANAAKRTGSLRSSQAQRALHFELPRKIRNSSTNRRVYERLLAELMRGL